MRRGYPERRHCNSPAISSKKETGSQFCMRLRIKLAGLVYLRSQQYKIKCLKANDRKEDEYLENVI